MMQYPFPPVPIASTIETSSDTVFPVRAISASVNAIADSESRTYVTSGQITPPFPSPPMTTSRPSALSRSIASTTLASPTGVRITFAL